MSEWPTIPLSATSSFIVDNRGKTAPTVEAGIPLIATNCIDSKDLYPTYKNVRYVSQETYDNWFRSHPQPNDIILTLKGSQNGAACLVPDPVGFVIAQDMVALRADETVIDYRFLLAALRSNDVQSEIKNLDVSGVIPHLKKSDFDKLQIPCPPLSVQQSIGKCYLDFCLKIDLLHRQNKTLEAMAETLFRQWFVEEAEDWVTIETYVEFNPRLSLAKGSVAPYLEMSNVSTAQFCPSHWYNREFKSGTKYQNGDTLLARITPCLENGKSTYVTFLNESEVGWGSTEFIVMRSRSSLSPFFTYALARNQDFREYAEGCLAGSSGRQRVDLEHLKRFEVGLVRPDRIQQFNNAIGPIPNRLHNNMLQIQTLEQFRDTLLPKLMSGEVRVAR